MYCAQNSHRYTNIHCRFLIHVVILVVEWLMTYHKIYNKSHDTVSIAFKKHYFPPNQKRQTQHPKTREIHMVQSFLLYFWPNTCPCSRIYLSIIPNSGTGSTTLPFLIVHFRLLTIVPLFGKFDYPHFYTAVEICNTAIGSAPRLC